MKIFIDTNNGFKCYTSNVTGKLLEFEEESFDGKCAEFVEGYVCKPEGYALNGKYADVKMIYPWKDYNKLEKAQLEYEVALYKAALEIVGVKV